MGPQLYRAETLPSAHVSLAASRSLLFCFTFVPQFYYQIQGNCFQLCQRLPVSVEPSVFSSFQKEDGKKVQVGNLSPTAALKTH